MGNKKVKMNDMKTCCYSKREFRLTADGAAYFCRTCDEAHEEQWGGRQHDDFTQLLTKPEERNDTKLYKKASNTELLKELYAESPLMASLKPKELTLNEILDKTLKTLWPEDFD